MEDSSEETADIGSNNVSVRIVIKVACAILLYVREHQELVSGQRDTDSRVEAGTKFVSS